MVFVGQSYFLHGGSGLSPSNGRSCKISITWSEKHRNSPSAEFYCTINTPRPVQIQEEENQTVTLSGRNSREFADIIKGLKKLDVEKFWLSIRFQNFIHAKSHQALCTFYCPSLMHYYAVLKNLSFRNWKSQSENRGCCQILKDIEVYNVFILL